jgi:hypothetical protein
VGMAYVVAGENALAGQFTAARHAGPLSFAVLVAKPRL